MADTSKTLPPLPQPYATSVTWHGYEGSTWQQWHDATDPMPTEWDDEAPDEVVHVYTADQMCAYAAAALAAQAQSTEASGPDYGPEWLGAAAARVLAQPEVAARHLRDYAAMLATQAQGEPVAWWIPAAEQFTLAKNGERPFAKAWQPLYAAPQSAAQPVRQPLTREQRMAVYARAEKKLSENMNLAWRDVLVDEVERAHGIGQEGGAA